MFQTENKLSTFLGDKWYENDECGGVVINDGVVVCNSQECSILRNINAQWEDFAPNYTPLNGFSGFGISAIGNDNILVVSERAVQFYDGTEWKLRNAATDSLVNQCLVQLDQTRLMSIGGLMGNGGSSVVKYI